MRLSMSTIASVAVAFVTTASAFGAETPDLVYEDTVPYDGLYRPLLIHQFNPLRGVLTGVKILVFQRPATRFEFELRGGNKTTRYPITAEVVARMYIRISDGLLLNRTHRIEISGTRTYNLYGYDGTLDYGGTSGVTREQYGTGGSTLLIRDLSVLTKFTGVPVGISNPLVPDLLSGTTQVDLRPALGATLTGVNGIPYSLRQSGSGRYTVVVNYVYTPLLG